MRAVVHYYWNSVIRLPYGCTFRIGSNGNEKRYFRYLLYNKNIIVSMFHGFREHCNVCGRKSFPAWSKAAAT